MSSASCRLAAQMRVLLASGQMVLHQFDCHVLIDGAVVAIPMCGGVGQPLHKLLHDHQVQRLPTCALDTATSPRLRAALPMLSAAPLPASDQRGTAAGNPPGKDQGDPIPPDRHLNTLHGTPEAGSGQLSGLHPTTEATAVVPTLPPDSSTPALWREKSL